MYHSNTPYKFLFLLLFLGFANIVLGQNPDLLDFNTQRLQINRTAMTKNPERLTGFGESIMLQGAFLLVFDLAVFWVHHQHGKDLHPLIGGLSLNGNGLSWRMVF